VAFLAAVGFDSVTGKGVQATVGGRAVLAGSARLLADAGISTAELGPIAAELSAQGKTPVLVALDGEPAGVLAVGDPVKDDSAAAIAAMGRLGVEVVMLTGDNATTSAAIAHQVGVRRVLAEVLPGHEAAEVQRLQAGGAAVGMVGDGINDAPAPAAADVGLAIGMSVDPASAPGRRDTQAGPVFFCSAGCAAAFDAATGRCAQPPATVPGAGALNARGDARRPRGQRADLDDGPGAV
jgi:P-type Cu+ transporter